MLYLIRHGETEWNRIGRIQGTSDVPLSPAGEAQARSLARWMRQQALHAVVASDLVRAHRTAELVTGGRVPIRTDPRLRERAFGPFEGRTMPEILSHLRARHGEVPESFDPVEAWPEGEGVETLPDLLARSLAVVHDVQGEARDGNVALVTHGNVIHVLLKHLLRIQAQRSVRLLNCSCIELEWRSERLMLRSMVSAEVLDAFLPPSTPHENPA